MLTEEQLLAMTDTEKVAHFSPFAQHVPLSKEHAEQEAAKAAKKEAAAQKKLDKEAEKARKLALKETLEKMTPEERKAYKKRLKNEQAMKDQPSYCDLRPEIRCRMLRR